MSKKDYQAIARAIHRVKPNPETAKGEGLQRLMEREVIRHDMWETCVLEMADVLAADSPRFDRSRFLEACETGTTRGMKK